MTKKATKRALLSSALALVVCISMLIGTTYAWFTDSVTSTNNIIKSGNLDVEVYWSTDAKVWNTVDAETNVFATNTYWEPGHTEVVYLKVKNEGSLALKYNLGINVVSETIGTNVAEESFKLSEYIYFGVKELDTATAYANRDAARNAIGQGAQIALGYTKATALESKAETILALVVYMPETVGNEANFKTGTVAPVINLGINLVATQQMSEKDSFGTDYDKDAEYETVTHIVPVPETITADYVRVYVTPTTSAARTVANRIDLGLFEVQTDADGNRFVEVEYDGFGTFELEALTVSKNGTDGGIDWKLFNDGTLVIAPTAGEPVADKNAPTKRTYEVGEWREAVVYKSNGSASAIGGYPYDVKAVKTLIIEEGVTTIGSFAAQFPNLTGEVVIPSTVTYIGQEAFHKAPITKLTFAEGGTEPLCIANGAFKKTLIEEVVFPGDREYIHIHHWAFGGSPNLKYAYIPENVTKSWGGEHVDYFDNFNSQTNVTWAEYGSIFTGCTKMETITFESEDARDRFFANNRQSTAEDYIVAYVGLTAYNSLDKAMAAAQNGDTVVIVNNITLKDTLVIPEDKNITLKIINNKSLKQSKACTESYSMIENKGTLTICGNGKITFTDTGAGDPNFGWGSYTITNRGTLVVNDSVTIENASKQNPGNGKPNVHMYCAIQQAGGTVTINGGTISNGTYRSVRVNKGDLIINGGTFKGQVWIQPNQGAATLKITGGTFAPTGNDSSSVFLTNAGEGYTVTSFEVTGGTFNTKIGCSNADALAGSIKGGDFNTEGTADILFAKSAN